jgi:RimJ/RimL family protein N-acetyltransferase
MIVRWTDNHQLMWETMTHASVYPHISDDTCPPPEEFILPPLSDQIFCAECLNDGEYMGCFCFFEQNDDEAEIHTCMLPKAKGLGKQFGDKMAQLFFSTKKYSIISTFVPENNILAKKLALKCGFHYLSEHKPIIIDGKEIPTQKYILQRGDVCL